MNKFYTVVLSVLACACAASAVGYGSAPVPNVYAAPQYVSAPIQPAVRVSSVVPVYNIPMAPPVVSYAAPAPQVAYGVPLQVAPSAGYGALPAPAPLAYSAPQVARYSSAAAAGSSVRSGAPAPRVAY